MPSVAFATYEQLPGICDDDRLAAETLSRRGIDVTAAVWDASDIEWGRFDRVVVRSTWDSHLKPDLYAGWIRTFLDRPGQLWNPPAVVLGNLDKRYLIDLASRGIAAVPTVCVTAMDREPLASIIERHAW